MIEIDMDMPQSCTDCPLLDPTYVRCMIMPGVPAFAKEVEYSSKKRAKHCPLKNASKTIDTLLTIIKMQSEENDTLFNKLKELTEELSRR